MTHNSKTNTKSLRASLFLQDSNWLSPAIQQRASTQNQNLKSTPPMNDEPASIFSLREKSAPVMKHSTHHIFPRRGFLKTVFAATALFIGSISAFTPTTTRAQVTAGSSSKLQLRAQTLATDANGRAEWQTVITSHTLIPKKSAIIICDMWDKHWSRGATERVAELAPRINALIRIARDRGFHIVHAPSDTMAFYANTPARQRVADAVPVDPPEPLYREEALLPIDDSDGGSDTGESPWYRAWSRQHPYIEIDQDRDGISDDGRQIYSYLKHLGVETIFIMGVHANMCVIDRSFGIKQMVRWGLQMVLVRDLTDTMYNPAKRPYVSHDEGTRLVVEYIEKFWCPSVDSPHLLVQVANSRNPAGVQP